MITSHAVKLLLRKLTADAKIGHRLPGLVNNLLSVSTLCDAGCEVFFHSTGCKVTHEGATILKGWQDQHNKLWRVQIVDNGWASNLKIKYDTHQIPLTTPPTGLPTSLPSAPTAMSAISLLAMTTVPWMSPLSYQAITRISTAKHTGK